MNCSPNSLCTAATLAGYMNMSVKQQMAVETYLDCQIANSGGGGGGGGSANIYVANYGGITPTPAPVGTATAFDTSNGSIWAYDGSNWIQYVA